MIFKKKKTQKGFTLIEMMVSVFIFALIMTAIVDIFARQISAYKYARTVQGDLENAQFALNYISKTLRTSSIIGVGDKAGGDPLIERVQGGNAADNEDYENDFFVSVLGEGEGLIVYDFSQEACVIFTFRGGNYKDGYENDALWMETQTGVLTSEIDSCLDASTWDNPSENYKDQRLTTGNVVGSFAVAPTRYMTHKDSRSTDTMGRATIAMRVEPSKHADVDNVKPIYVQSSVALRDYPSDLSF